MKKGKRMENLENIVGLTAGIGGFVTVHRLNRAIRPRNRFVLAEIGVVAFEWLVGFACYGSMTYILDTTVEKMKKEFKEKEESEATDTGTENTEETK